MESLKKEMTIIQVSNYDKDKVCSFIDNHSFVELFQKINEEAKDDNEINQFTYFLSQIFKIKPVVQKFLMESTPAHQALLHELIMHENEKYREIIPMALENYINEITPFLNTGIASKNPVIEEYLGALFLQLEDEDTSVGMKMYRNLENIVKESNKYDYSLIKSDIFIKFLQSGLKNSDSVIAMRYLDLILFITNQSENLFNFYHEKGFYDSILSLYQTDDLLVKLAIVESIHKLGDSVWNAKFIANSSLFKAMLIECFDKNSDLYIQKNHLILIAKLISKNIIKLDVKLKSNISKQLKSWLMSGYNEEIMSALEVISYIVLRHEGVEMLNDDKDNIYGFYPLANSPNQNIKKKFLLAFSQIFNIDYDLKDQKYLKKSLILLGDITDLINYKITIMEISKEFTKAFDYLFKILFLPFADMEIAGLNILKELFKHDWALFEFCRHSKSMKYLTEHTAKGIEILNMKIEIIKDIINRLIQPDQKDIHLIQYAKTLTEYLKLKESSKKSDIVSYETEIL